MSSLADIRAAVAAALDAVATLNAHATVPGQITPPAAVVAPDSITYDTDFEGGATYRFPVQVLVQLGNWSSAQTQLDAFVSHDGTAVAAVDGVTSYECRVVAMEGYGLTDFGGVDYLGAVLVVEVIV